MKKIISAVMAVAVLFTVLAVPIHAQDSRWQTDSEIIQLLSGLDIMVGDDYGNFDLDSYVTRAQMAKIAVAASSYKNTVAIGLQFSPFSDVKGSYWGAPYIRAAVSAGIVNGYIDGTFRPDGTVTYEEAITMMLRVLGYTSEDFGASYPYGQVGMAEGLKMTDGMGASLGMPLTRRDVAKLVCNTLDTKQKSSGQELIAVHDCAFVDDVTIIASHTDDKSLGKDEISTSAGKLRIDKTFNDSYVGCKGDMVIKNGKYFVAFSSDSAQTSDKYVVYSTLNDAILCYPDGNNTSIKQFRLSDSTTCYKDSVAYTYGSLRSQMEMGDIVRIRYRDNGEVDYISYSEGSLEGPVRVDSDLWINGFDTNASTKIVRDGKQVSQSDVKVNDILYYSSSLNMIMAYTQKVTGVYEDAVPSKDLPRSVVISGVTYEVEGVDAFNAFSSNGSVNIGDTVTVLLGRDGEKIAGIATLSQLSGSTAGYITGAGKKEFKNSDNTTYTSYYIDVVTVDGSVYSYPTEYDKSSSVGMAARVTLKDSKATVGALNSSSISGYVDYQNMTIGTRPVANDIKILDISDENGTDAPLYTKTYMQRLDGLTLSPSNVIYYKLNSDGKVSELMLKNTTGDMYEYGITTSGYSSGKGYGTVDIDGRLYNLPLTSLQFGKGTRVVRDLSGSVKAAYTMSSYDVSKGNLNQREATVGSKTYRLSDRVKVYRKNGQQFMQISLNEAISGDYNYNCYYDKAENKGGRIRVIVAH